MADLTPGTVSEEVQLVQNLMTDIANTFGRSDFNPGPANGVYGTQTAAAVANMQAAVGLNPTGTVDDTTYSAISALWDSDPSTVSFYTAPGDLVLSGVAPGTPPPAATSSVPASAVPAALPATTTPLTAAAPNWTAIGIVLAIGIGIVYLSSREGD